ncbi:MAG: stage II sporulation protein P [Negativicutes bacterium]|nr:stage II sporulation protein P [Negativicutes bacterium]
MVTRQQRKQSSRKKWWLTAAILAVMAVVGCGLYFGASEQAVPASTAFSLEEVQGRRFLPRWRDVLSAGIPGFVTATETPAAVKVRPEVTAQSVMRSAVLFFTGVDVKDMRSFFRVEIPFVALFENGSPTVNAMSLPNFPKFEWKTITPSGKPLVGIYHTHTAESFIPSSGVAHKPGGQRGDIVDVGEALVKRLAQHGITAVQSKNIHDYPSFMKAYGPSEVTARKMLEENPSIQMLLDIHRDADKRENATAVINGVPMAKITMVVGMGQPDLVQPHWQQNHAFAKLVDAKLNQYYPGLSRGIQLVEWRYNQHLHPRALLLEVGCQENSKEEVIASIELLGDILAEILAES